MKEIVNNYIAELDFSNCSNKYDKESVIIRVCGTDGIQELNFDEFMTISGRFYIKELKQTYNYFYAQFEERGMLVNTNLEDFKLKENEFQFLKNASTKSLKVLWLKTANKLCSDVKSLNTAAFKEKDLEKAYKILASGIEIGLDGITFSGSGYKFMKKSKGDSYFKCRFSDDLMIKGNSADTEYYPYLTKTYLGKKGRIGDSMLGAITRGAEEGYFDYLGKSITIDAVSLYASLVRRMKMPYGRPRVVSWESFCYAKEAKTALHLIRFSVTRATAKNLAWRGKEHFNNILYPEVFLGETFNMWCFELDLFKETYDLQGVRVIEILQFKAAANMFNKEIDFLFKKKEENKLYKPMLNGAFGRFSKDPKSSAVFDYPSYQEGEKEFIKVDNSDTYLAFFSCLLAYGRVELVSTIFKLGVENFLYSDTDSITFKGEIPSHFKTGDNLGDWKIESHNTYFRHLKAKTYMKTTENGDVFKASGFSAEAMEEVTKENFMLGTKLVDYEWYMNGIIPKLKKRSKYLGGEEYRQNEKFNIDEDLYPVLDKQLYEGKYINVASFINQFDDETREEMLRNLKFDISHIS